MGLPHKPYTTHTLPKSTALLSTPQLTSQSTPQHTDTPQSIMLLHTIQLQSTTLRFMPQSITQPQLLIMPQLYTSQLHIMPQLQLYISQLHMLPQLYTSQLLTQPQLTTNQLLIMNQPMKDQLYTNTDTLSKMITPRLLSLPAKTVTEMPPPVATLLLFPMAAPNMLNTLLMLMVAMSLMFHTKVLPNTQNTNQLHITQPQNQLITQLPSMPKTATYLD